MTAPEKALVDELERESNPQIIAQLVVEALVHRDILIEQQAREMTAARAEIERLREALGPFAEMEATAFVGSIYETADDDMVVLFNHATGVKIHRRDFRRARSTLAKEEAGR